jgi:hypothetical protein
MRELGGSWERRSCADAEGLDEWVDFMHSTSKGLSRSRMAPRMRPGGSVVGMSRKMCYKIVLYYGCN